LKKKRLGFRVLVWFILSQMLGCRCTKNLIPNLLMLDTFRIRSPTPPILTQCSNSLIIWRFIIRAGNRTSKIAVNNNSVPCWLTVTTFYRDKMFYRGQWEGWGMCDTWKALWWGIVTQSRSRAKLDGE
jgi:hypothetical protein